MPVMKVIQAYILVIYSITANAQVALQDVITRMNEALLEIESGEYQVRCKSKSLLEKDTNIYEAHVKYFKTVDIQRDTVARFILWTSGDPFMQGSDGEVYFYVYKDSVIAIDKALKKRGVITYISRGNALRSRVLSLPILTNRGHLPVKPEEWSTARVGYFLLNDTNFIEIYRRRMFQADMKITPTARDSIIYTEQWLLYPDTYTPRRISAWADLQDGHVQFDESNFTPIKSLTSDATFEKEYDMPKMLKEGYRVVEINKNEPKKREEVATGDSIPDFMIRLETGEDLPLFSAFKQRYLLLDFWYRGCAPCNTGMPGLDRISKTLYGKDLIILAINPIDKQYNDIIEQYKIRYGYSFQIAFTERNITNQIKIIGYPTLLVIDQHTRRVIYTLKGYSKEGEELLIEFLSSLLQQ